MTTDPSEELLFKSWRSDDQDLDTQLVEQLLPSGSLLKSAAARVFSADTLRDLTPPDGWWGAHNVALGSLENWGFNRNGDGFPRDTLINRHQTFVKHGRVYRNHAHTDLTQILGVVKAAAYNHELDRVELISWMKKSASEGEFAEARRGKQHTYSMSAHMPWDECSLCQNRAKSRETYCEDLKPGSILRYDSGLQKYAYALNIAPNLVFFDNSIVPRPADRSALNLRYMWAPGDAMVKAAAARPSDIVSGAQRASDIHAAEAWQAPVMVPLSALMSASSRAALVKLANAETHLRNALSSSTPDPFTSGVLRHARSDGHLALGDIKRMRSVATGTLFHHLAKHASVLPLAEFAAYTLECSPEEAAQMTVVKDAHCCMPTLFNDMLSQLDDISLPLMLQNAFTGSSEVRASMDPEEDEVQQIMDKANELFGVSPDNCERRAMLSITKHASAPTLTARDAPVVSAEARNLANIYGLYKLAALKDITASRNAVSPQFFEAVIAGLNFAA